MRNRDHLKNGNRLEIWAREWEKNETIYSKKNTVCLIFGPLFACLNYLEFFVMLLLLLNFIEFDLKASNAQNALNMWSTCIPFLYSKVFLSLTIIKEESNNKVAKQFAQDLAHTHSTHGAHCIQHSVSHIIDHTKRQSRLTMSFIQLDFFVCDLIISVFEYYYYYIDVYCVRAREYSMLFVIVVVSFGSFRLSASAAQLLLWIYFSFLVVVVLFSCWFLVCNRKLKI